MFRVLRWRGTMSHVVLWATLIGLVACQSSPSAPDQAPSIAATTGESATRNPGVPKNVSFAVLEDYDKGDDLDDIARDFQLMQELEVDVMRCSFGWDDYEPSPGKYDFAWLEQFVALAAQYNIKLRPYIAYTPAWAGKPGADDTLWNDPPASYRQWYNFVYNLAAALSDHPKLLSYEIYNEVNSEMCWDGTNYHYK